jgi:threonine dehydratase
MSRIESPTVDEVRHAARQFGDVVLHTPLVPLHCFGAPSHILLKPEILQKVHSFKIRGVFHAVASMSEEERQRGISTVSAGNTAQALAWVGRHFGVTARSVMPDSAPESKIDAVRSYGGTPVLVPMAEVFRTMRDHLWEDEPYSFVHPWTDRNVMIGHATLALEILEDCPDVDSVFVPVGGGGLMGGVGSAIKALKPDTKVFAVEPAGCASLHDSIAAGKPVSVQCDTICDGVAVPYMTDEMFPLLRDVVDEVILVSEADVISAVKRLALGNKMIAEPSGGLATAAALAMPEERRGRSVCLVTGGSIDAQKLVSILAED